MLRAFCRRRVHTSSLRVFVLLPPAQVRCEHVDVSRRLTTTGMLWNGNINYKALLLSVSVLVGVAKSSGFNSHTWAFCTVDRRGPEKDELFGSMNIYNKR